MKPNFSILPLLSILLTKYTLTQSCLKYTCADLSDNVITDSSDSIPFCVYKTEINPGQILIDSTICGKSKSILLLIG